MKPFTITLLAIIAIVNFSFATPGTPSKVVFPKSFAASLQESKYLFEAQAAKVCACQILRVASKNQTEAVIAVFAQATNTGELNFNFSNATSVLEKEKKHLKEFFFTSVKTAENVTAPTECSMLYKNIQVKYANVKMYDVLDADALANRNLNK